MTKPIEVTMTMTTDKLVFIDCETTGVDTENDRCWQFSAICEGEPDVNLYLNPCIPVPPEVVKLSARPDLNAFLADKPTFKEKADEILACLNKGVLAGFCLINFDIPILWRELYRAGKIWIGLQDRPVIDVGQIYKRKEARTLAAAVKFYTGGAIGDAHNAACDALATRSVFEAQKDRYEDIGQMSIKELSKFCQPDNRVDLAGKLIYNEAGVECFNIGNEKNVPVLDKPQFAKWMLERDFPEQTKLVLRTILARKDTKQKELL